MEQLSTVMQNIGLALLTIFIPLAISLFQKDDLKEFVELDNRLIFDKFFDIKSILWKVGLIFVPLILWNFSTVPSQWFLFVIWAIGIFFLCDLLIRSYGWLRKDRQGYRYKYLRTQILSDEETLIIWNSIWSSEKLNHLNEDKFFEIFSDTINRLLSNNTPSNLLLSSKLLQGFCAYIEKSNIMGLTFEGGIFSKILSWHEQCWLKETEFLIQEINSPGNLYGGYSQITNVLDVLLKMLTIKAVSNYNSYGYFHLFSKHLDSYIEIKVIGPIHTYLYMENFLAQFYHVLFKEIGEAVDKYDIWDHYFPQALKVTKNNLTGNKSLLSNISLMQYINWAETRLWRNGNNEIDLVLEEVSKNLFPDVEPYSFAMLITFMLRPFGENRVKSLLDSPRTFGYMGRIFIGDRLGEEGENAYRENVAQQEIATIDLVYFIFKNVLTDDLINKTLLEISQFENEPGSDKEIEKNNLLRYFQLFQEKKRQDNPVLEITQ